MKWLRKVDAFFLIIGLYAVSTVLLSTIPFKSWQTLALGLFLAAFGSLVCFLLMRQRYSPMENPRFSPALASALPPDTTHVLLEKSLEEAEEKLLYFQQRQGELLEEVNAKKKALHVLETEKGDQAGRLQELLRELANIKDNTEEELRRKNVLLAEYQETINQQRDVITKKQEQIAELEAKVHDLNYEVKTLLQLAEMANKQNISVDHGEDAPLEDLPRETTPHRMIKTAEEASAHLKRCIDIAQKITSANRFGSGMQSRFKDLPIDNRALDLRRLFDNLRSENAAVVFVFSQKENTVLFANPQMTDLLGWSMDKFTQQFSEIIAEGAQEWVKGISALSTSSEAKARLVVKMKSGKNILLHCHLGIVPTGAFRNHIIAVLYPV